MDLVTSVMIQNQKCQEVIEQVKILIKLSGKGDISIDYITELIQAATQEAIDKILQQLEGLDVLSLNHRMNHADRMLTDIMLILDANGMSTSADGTIIESFNPPTKIDVTRINVISIVPASSEIDVASEPEIGKEYTLSDGVSEQETVIVSAVIRAGNTIRVQLTKPVQGTYRSGTGVLTRTTAVIYDGSAHVGGNEKTSEITPNETFSGDTIPGGAMDADVAFNSTTKGSFEILGAPFFGAISVKLAPFVGIAMMDTTLGVNGWQYVDAAANLMTIGDPTGFFAEFGLTNPFEETIDGQTMVRLLMGSMKSWIGEVGSNAAGKFCMGISPSEIDTLTKRHPAFYNYEATPDGSGNVPEVSFFRMGKFEGSLNGGKIESLIGKAPRANVNLANASAECRARNVGAFKGFCPTNFWMKNWVQILMMIRAKNGDLQAVAGRGHVDNTPANAVNTGAAPTVTYMGINSLWGNVYEWEEGMDWDSSGNVRVWAPGKAKQFVSLGFKNVAGYPKTIKMGNSVALGNRDLGITLFGETADASKPIISDHQSSPGAAYVPLRGGSWDYTASAGPGYLSYSHAAGSNANIGVRLGEYPEA